MKTGPTVLMAGNEIVQERINNSDIIHYKGDHPHGREFHGLTIPNDKKIIYTVSGSDFRRNMDSPEFIKQFKGDLNTYMTKDLHVDGWEYMPQPYNLFDYRWKKGKKLKIVHIPSDPSKKGSAMIEQAMEILAAKGVDFEYIYRTGILHHESLMLKRDASIYIDQMVYSCVANAAYEAMGFGVPVISWSDDDIVMSPKQQTAEALAELIESLTWGDLRLQSQKQFRAVQLRCGGMGRRWSDTYKNLLT